MHADVRLGRRVSLHCLAAAGSGRHRLKLRCAPGSPAQRCFIALGSRSPRTRRGVENRSWTERDRAEFPVASRKARELISLTRHQACRPDELAQMPT